MLKDKSAQFLSRLKEKPTVNKVKNHFVTFSEIDKEGIRQSVVVNLTMIQRLYESRDMDNPGIYIVFTDGCTIKVDEDIEAIINFYNEHVRFN
jgi:hypothetical protein